MIRFTLLISLCACSLAISAHAAQVQTYAPTYALKARAAVAETQYLASAPARAVTGKSSTKAVGATGQDFTFRDESGKVVSASVVAQPFAKIDRRLSPTLMRAASIAQERAHAHSKSRCWHYVKTALVASGAVSSYPKTAYAKQAGDELVNDYGFKKLPIRDPYAAPIGAVLVYGSGSAAGHVEIRTKTGFVSDFKSLKPSKRRLIGVYAKA